MKLFLEVLKKIRLLGLLLFTMATSFYTHSQVRNDDDIDGLLDDLFFSEQQFLDELIDADFSYNLVYTSISFNNKTYFSGRDSGTNQFNIVPQITYYNSSGFNASISGIYYESYYPNWDFTSVSLGYFNTLGKKKIWQYNLGYTKYFYSDGYDVFTNSLDVSIGIRNNKRTLGSMVSASYLFGRDNSYQIISSSYVSFNLKRTDNIALRIRPRINFILAKQTFSVDRFILLNGRRVLRTFTSEIFDLLNTQLNFPLSLSIKSWDFELGYNLNIPNSIANESSLKSTGFFNFSIGYLFDLSRK